MRIAIVGLGLIGGSLGLDLRRLGHGVVGVSRNPMTCDRAVALGAADEAGCELARVEGAAVVFLCPPLDWVISMGEAVLPHLSPGAILTDVGSVKQPIVQALSSQWPQFIGGHPMAGTAHQGIEAAESRLFQGRPYVLTPTTSTPAASLEVLAGLVQSLGSTLYYCPPDQHDQAVAWISHLPVLVSASLIQACQGESQGEILRLAQQLASSGFRDTSRVGGGNPELGTLMARYNREALLTSLRQYQGAIAGLTQLVEAENWAELQQQLQATQVQRSAFVDP
jgi:arogenate dehydrogenase (NADP+)